MGQSPDTGPTPVLSYQSEPVAPKAWPARDFLVFAVDFNGGEEVRLRIRGNGLSNVNATAKRHGLGPIGIFEWQTDPVAQRELMERLPATMSWRDAEPIEDFDPRAGAPVHSSVVIDGMPLTLRRMYTPPNETAGREACWIGGIMTLIGSMIGLRLVSAPNLVAFVIFLAFLGLGIALIVLGVQVTRGKLLAATIATALLTLISLAVVWGIWQANHGAEVFFAGLALLAGGVVLLHMTLALVHLLRHPADRR